MLSGVVKLLPNFKNLIKSPAPKSLNLKSKANSKKRVFHSKSRSTRKLAIKLSVVLLGVAFLLDYQPAIGSFPPIKQSIARADFEQTQTITAQISPLTFQLPHPGYISTHFSTFHPGVDIAAGLGLPVHPIAKGKVINSGYNFWGLGLVIEIDHGYGYKSLYAHIGKIYVKEGQQVSENDLIGEVGLTGHTSGPHTHLEISRSGINIDPTTLLPKLPDLALAWANASASAQLAQSNAQPIQTPTPHPTINPFATARPTPSLSQIAPELSNTKINLSFSTQSNLLNPFQLKP